MVVLRPPRLRAAEADAHRAASWLELFFDLVFVVAIAQLGAALDHDLSDGGVARFALLFAPVWWSWAGYTMYADRFDTDDVAFRLLLLAGMLGVAAMAVAIPAAFAGRSVAFALAYVAVRAALILRYARA